MKILIVNTYHYRRGGDSTYALLLADLLKSKGHVTAFFAMEDECNIPDPNFDLFVSHIDFQLLNGEKNLVNCFRVLSRAIYSSEARKKFSQLIMRFSPDIIHLQNIHAHITPSIIFEAKKHKIPVVWTLHDYKLICPNTHFLLDDSGIICEACGKYGYYRSILKRCKKNSTLASTLVALEAYIHRIMRIRNMVECFIAPSSFLREKMINFGFRPEKIVHLPLFLPEYYFSENDRISGFFLFMSKIEHIKGILHLIEACRQEVDIDLRIAGSIREPFDEVFHKQLPNNATYLGVLGEEELRNTLSEARSVILPSLCYENQPFSILEAFAAGKPVIASDIGGMSELLRKSNGGILIPPGDVTALRNAMHWIMLNPSRAKEMGKNAQEYIKGEHNANWHYERLINIYERVIC